MSEKRTFHRDKGMIYFWREFLSEKRHLTFLTGIFVGKTHILFLTDIFVGKTSRENKTASRMHFVKIIFIFEEAFCKNIFAEIFYKILQKCHFWCQKWCRKVKVRDFLKKSQKSRSRFVRRFYCGKFFWNFLKFFCNGFAQ